MYVARKATHISADIKRNWSSWNFGEGGVTGTLKMIEDEMNEAIENDEAFLISGFELWGQDIKEADIRELYPNYWVLVDNVNARGGLSCIELEAENLQSAIEESKKAFFFGDGDVFDASEANLVYSCPNNEIHIFEIEG